MLQNTLNFFLFILFHIKPCNCFTPIYTMSIGVSFCNSLLHFFQQCWIITKYTGKRIHVDQLHDFFWNVHLFDLLCVIFILFFDFRFSFLIQKNSRMALNIFWLVDMEDEDKHDDEEESAESP